MMRLEIDQVSVRIQSKRIVESVQLTVLPGSIVGLLGPNGSGKSTLLRAVYRMLRPSAGYIRLGGDDVWALSARDSARRTGVVVQETPSDFQFTVREIVHMGRTPHKNPLSLDTLEDARIIDNALKRVEMANFADRLFPTLSGGEKQRVLVARALAQQPQILVLDEPTNHLDIHHQLDILELVRGLGITTLITLHDLNLAAAYCHQLYILADGCIVAEGTPEETLTGDLIRRVFRVDAISTRHPVTQKLQLSFVPLTHREV